MSNFPSGSISFLEHRVYRDFPGGAVVVARDGNVLYEEYGGASRLIPSVKSVKSGTLFDLASVTKPLVTGKLWAVLCQKGLVDWDMRVGDVFRHGNTALLDVKLTELLGHTGGLPGYLPLYKAVPLSRWGTEEAKEIFIKKILSHEPRTRGHRVYSDLGFMLLGFAFEKVTGETLEELFEKYVLNALSGCRMVGLGGCSGGYECAATELSLMEGRVLEGEVHDENARALGGLAGHAGLFASARDTMILATEWLFALKGRGRIMSRSVCERMLFHQDGYPLAWDIPEGPHSIYGSLPPGTFAHAGFTGTTVAIRPETGLCVVFLTNRVHPSRLSYNFRSTRREVMEEIFRTWEVQ